MIRVQTLNNISSIGLAEFPAGQYQIATDIAEVVLNQLYKFTPLQSSFGVNMLALNHGRPEQMGLRALLEAFLDFREEVVVRRVKFELNKARDRGHVLVGLAVAVLMPVLIHPTSRMLWTAIDLLMRPLEPGEAPRLDS